MTGITTELRVVRAFDNLDQCRRDVDVRGDCVMFDVYGYWWSVPLEVTVHQAAAEIEEWLELHDALWRHEMLRPAGRALRVVQ